MGLAGEIDGMRFTHIGLEEGLSHSTIFGITQAKEGPPNHVRSKAVESPKSCNLPNVRF